MPRFQLLRQDFECQGRRFTEPELWTLVAYRLSVCSVAMSLLIERVTVGNRVAIIREIAMGQDQGGTLTIGNDLWIGVGGKVLGPVDIEDGATRAANSPVTSHVPVGAFAIGVPAKPVRWA